MAVIKAFKAVRPCVELADKIAALPYDVYNREEAKREVSGDNLSFLRIDRPETQFPDGYDMYAPEVYNKAREMYDDMKVSGSYIKEEKPVLFIYELIMDGRSQTGIVACASIDDYINGVIKKHENTRADKELDRIKHVDTMGAQTGPIFLAYRKRERLSEIVNAIKTNEKLFGFTSNDGITHNVWVVNDDDIITEIQKEFSETPNVYIADGHHRAASAVKVGIKRRNECIDENGEYTGDEEFNYFLSVLFPDDELKILPYNRVIKSLNGYTIEEIFEKIGEVCEISEVSEAYGPLKKATFGMYVDGKWYCLTMKDAFLVNDPVEGLDVSLLQNNILKPIFGIDDPRTSKEIDFVGGIRGLKELERRVNNDAVIAFSMYPTSIAELFMVADNDMLMPPKSTWFEPKLRSGIFIHELL